VKKLDAFESSLGGKGWKESSVQIKVPCPGHQEDETGAAEFEVPGVFHWDLVDIIKVACLGPRHPQFIPYYTIHGVWKPSEDADPIQLYGEAYTSDEMISAYEEVQSIPPDPEHPDV
jgi:hypothetical protein